MVNPRIISVQRSWALDIAGSPMGMNKRDDRGETKTDEITLALKSDGSKEIMQRLEQIYPKK